MEQEWRDTEVLARIMKAEFLKLTRQAIKEWREWHSLVMAEEDFENAWRGFEDDQ